MTKILKEPGFRKLSREVGQILALAQNSSNLEKTAGYWAVGERIKNERLSQEAGYHNSVLRELAQAIDVSGRTLQHAVLLRQAYQSPPTAPLPWAHYRLLAALPSAKERTFYTKLAVAQAWSVRDLQSAIRADRFGGGTPASPSSVRPSSPGYVYRASAPHLVDADTLDLDIDLGFQTWTKRRIRLANIDAPEGGSPQGRAAKNFVQKHLARAQTITVRTQRADLHGRYVGDLFLSTQSVSLDDCYANGLHLNTALVAAGHATVFV